MDEGQRSAVSKNLPYIVQYMDSVPVLDHLHDLFTHEEIARVQANAIPQNKNRELISILQLKGDSGAFENFLEALDKTKQKNFADKIRTTYFSSVNAVNQQNAGEIARLTQEMEALKLVNEQKIAAAEEQMQQLKEANTESMREMEKRYEQKFTEYAQQLEQRLLTQSAKMEDICAENEQLKRNIQLLVKNKDFAQVQAKVQEVSKATSDMKNDLQKISESTNYLENTLQAVDAKLQEHHKEIKCTSYMVIAYSLNDGGSNAARQQPRPPEPPGWGSSHPLHITYTLKSATD